MAGLPKSEASSPDHARPKQRRSNVDRVAETRGVLLAAASLLFGREGYDATSTNAILTAAGLTRGALYHHFPDKRALFLAVAERLDAEIAGMVADRIASIPDRGQRLRQGVRLYLLAMAEAPTARILLIDAPAVLGLAAWRQLSGRLWVRYLDGLLPEPLSDPLTAELIGALIDRAALALSDRPEPERAQALQTVDDLLGRLTGGEPLRST
jgi:AcrR family transcriptional regulator